MHTSMMHHNQTRFIPGIQKRFNIFLYIHVISQNNTLKKNHMSLLVNTENSVGKSQCLLMEWIQERRPLIY